MSRTRGNYTRSTWRVRAGRERKEGEYKKAATHNVTESASNNGNVADSRLSVPLMIVEWRSPLMSGVGQIYE